MSAISELKRAKENSDKGRYGVKHQIIKKMMTENPDAFYIDSDDGKGIVGVTHKKTGFRFHMPAGKVRPGLSKAAGLSELIALMKPYANATKEVMIGSRLPLMSEALKEVPEEVGDLNRLAPNLRDLLKFSFGNSTKSAAWDNEDSPLFDPLNLTAVGAGGVAYAGHRAADDIDKVNAKLSTWADTTGAAAGAYKGDLDSASRVISAYADGGRDVIKSKVLGLPIPYAVAQLTPMIRGTQEASLAGPGDYLRTALAKLTGDMSATLPRSNSDLHEHYRKFFSTARPSWIRGYMETFGYNGTTNELGRKIISDPTLSMVSRLDKLNKVDPAAADGLRAHMPALVKRLGGSAFGGVVHGGLADLYRSRFTPFNQSLSRAARATGRVALPVAAAATLASLWNNRGRITKQATEDSNNLGFASVIPTALGGALAASGVNDLRSPLDVGVSYGTMPRIGAGHKTPANSIIELLSEISTKGGVPAFNLHRAERNDAGWVDPRVTSRAYDGMIDTGLGAYVSRGVGQNYSPFVENAFGDNPAGGREASPHSAPRVRHGGLMSIQTDLGTLGMPGNSAASVRHAGGVIGNIKDRALRVLTGTADSFVSYDPKPELLQSNPLMRRMSFKHTGDHGFPTLTPTALTTLKSLRGVSRDTLIGEMLADKSLALPPDTRKLLENIGGKRVLAITGSGRGDNVAYRALRAQQELAARGLTDKWQVVAALGDSAAYNPLARQAAVNPNILTFDKLPQRYYIGLPGKADVHLASSGTSALMESLGTDSLLAFHKNQNAVKGRELAALGSFEHNNPQGGDFSLKNIKPHAKVWGDMPNAESVMHGIQNVDLDNWNKHNKEFAFNMPGVRSAENTKELVDMLGDESLFSSTAVAERTARADYMVNAHTKSRDNLSNILQSFLKKRRSFKNFKGTSKLVGAAGLLGAGVAPLLSSLVGAKSDKPTLGKLHERLRK